MKKVISKVAALALGLSLAAGTGLVVTKVGRTGEVKAAQGDTVATFSSASVVGGTDTSYKSYSDSNWNLSVGGNRVSCGWNKTASNAKQVGSTFAIDSTSVTATTYGWVASTKSALSNVGKLEFSYTGGSGNDSGKLWLASSSNGSTYSKVTLTTGTQGSACGSTNTTYTFEFDTISSAYFAIIVTGGTSGKVFRFDSVTATFKEGATADLGLDTLTIKANGTEADSATMNYSIGTSLFYAYDESDNEVTGCDWSISDDSIASIALNGNNVAYVTFIKYGTVVITAEKSGYNNGTFELTINPGTLDSVVVTGSMTKTSYYVGESWTPAGLVATASYSYGYSYDASDDVTWSYSPSSPSVGVTSVVATATLSSISGSSSSQAVTVSRTNPIQVIYTRSSGSVDVYGYYVGFLDGTGPVIMDGAYGIVVYNKTAVVSGYTAGETILHVTGSISIFNGLYEIASASISVASGTFDEPDEPVVYAAKGGETADCASRLTTVTGTAVVTKGSFDSAAGTADITMNFTVGSATVQVFYKKAAQTADSEAFSAMKSAVKNGTEITIKGFTGWYNGFQVQMNGYVPAAVGYTAEDFSQDLLDQTDAACALADTKTHEQMKSALTSIWNNLASNDKYPSLPSKEKTVLADANRDESGSVVEQAMARYDWLCGKYELTNFINGRTPVAFAPAVIEYRSVNNNASTIVIVVVALTSITSIGVLLVIKRKRSLIK